MVPFRRDMRGHVVGLIGVTCVLGLSTSLLLFPLFPFLFLFHGESRSCFGVKRFAERRALICPIARSDYFIQLFTTQHRLRQPSIQLRDAFSQSITQSLIHLINYSFNHSFNQSSTSVAVTSPSLQTLIVTTLITTHFLPLLPLLNPPFLPSSPTPHYNTHFTFTTLTTLSTFTLPISFTNLKRLSATFIIIQSNCPFPSHLLSTLKNK